MAFVADNAIDAALEYLQNNADKLVLCSQEPTTFAEADTTYKVAEVALTPADFTVANGDVSGRKVTMAAKTVVGTAAGTATHYALVDVGTSELIVVNTMTNVAIENGGNQDVNAVDVWEIQDPV